MLTKTDALRQIEKDLGRVPEVRSICESIVNFLSAEQSAAVERVTFGLIKRVACLDAVEDAIPALEYLTGARLHLLEPRFEFVDTATDYVEEIPLDVVAEAREQSVFYHPVSGEEVENFESALFMFFVPSREGRCLGGES